MPRFSPCFVARLSAIAVLAFLPARAGTIDGVDADVAAAMDQIHSPGVAVGIIRHGEVVLARGYGVTAVGGVQAVNADTLFAVGSMTKAVTTTVLAMQADEGKLNWDRPVRDILPWFEMADPVATALITPKDLVTHRSGLPRHDFIRFSTYLSREELVRRIRYLPLNHTFRDVYQYNNLTYTTAGYLSEVIDKAPWEDVVRRRIFEPLGMARSTCYTEAAMRDPNVAHPHELHDGKATEVPFYVYQKFGVGPNGAVNTSVNEYFAFMQLHLDNGLFGGRQLVSEAQMKLLHKPVMLENAERSYALGWSVTLHRGTQVLEHGGAITGFTSQVVLLPDRHEGVVVVNNLSSALPRIVAWEIVDRLLGLAPRDYLAEQREEDAAGARRWKAREAELEAKRLSGTAPTLAPAAYEGVYTHPAFGAVRVTLTASGYEVHFSARTLAIKPWGGDTFLCQGPDVYGLGSFGVDPKDGVRSMALPLESAVAPLVFTRQGS